MIVLHAGYCDSLLLWAETSESAPAAGKRRKDRLTADFACEAANLLKIAAELGVSSTKRETRAAVVWLPSNEELPVPSTALLGGDAAMTRDPFLAPWIVPALPLDGTRSIPLLAACAGKPLLRPGLLAGTDLCYWAGAMRFAAGLVMRGQFLPSAADEGTRAQWRPVIAGPDTARFEALGKAMPPSARALVHDVDDHPPKTAANSILRRFINGMVDALVRESIAERRRGAFESVHDRWLHALGTADGVVGAEKKEAETLARQIEQWQRPIQVSASAPFRLSFRLEEPLEESAPWMVRYLLQGNRDPSLLLPAADAWNLKPSAASALGLDAGRLREHLLASLGQAAGIYLLLRRVFASEVRKGVNWTRPARTVS